MTANAQWHDLTAQHLVRYEALFKLLDDIQALEDIPAIAQQVATQWKYFAGVAAWRLVIAAQPGFLLIDGARGDIEEVLASRRRLPRLHIPAPLLKVAS